jgi:hypothetical protein
MQLGSDVFAQRFQEHVDEGAGRSAGIDRAGHLRRLPGSCDGPEELDVPERLVEDRELLRAGARAGPDDLPPGVREREHPRLAALRVDCAANAEESRDDLREDDQRCT